MAKLTDAEKLYYITLATGKVPSDFTPAGLTEYITKVAMPVVVAMSSVNKEDFDSVKARNTKVVTPLAVDENGEEYLLTDEMVINAKKPDKLWAKFLERVRSTLLPPCVNTMPHALEHYLENKFFYTRGQTKRLVYFRNLNKEGTVWQEATDSDAPFSSLHGRIRKEMNTALSKHVGERCVMVYRVAEDGHDYTENVNLAQLYKEVGKTIMSRVQKTEKGIAYKFVVERMKEEIESLNSAWNGHTTNFAIEYGLKNLPALYSEIDSSVEFYEQFYREESNIVTFTNNPEVDAFNYFDLNKLHDGPTPAFDMFIQGVVPECRETLMAAIYANFDERCLLNQYIWLHGEGGDGKSSLLNAIREYCGPEMCCALTTDSTKSEFGLEETVGKRIVMFPDIQSGLSVKSGVIHKLTGHDLVPINRKNKPHISTHINCIVWMAANSAPDVNFSNANEARRCIYIKMQEPPIEVQKQIYFTNPDGSFQLDAEGNRMNNGFPLKEKLLEEMPCILFKCKKVFEEKVKAPYSVIRLTKEETKIASDNCSDFDDDSLTYYINKTFTFTQNPDDKLPQPEITNAMNLTLKCDNLPAMDNSLKRKMFRKIDNYFHCKQVKSNGVKLRSGIKLKDE